MGIISDLRFWGEKKKWPKGLEPVGDLCRQADVALCELAGEVIRLRVALSAAELREKEATAKALEHAANVAEGNYDHIGVQTKHDRCPHGKFEWEDCDQCVAAAIRALKDEVR